MGRIGETSPCFHPACTLAKPPLCGNPDRSPMAGRLPLSLKAKVRVQPGGQKDTGLQSAQRGCISLSSTQGQGAWVGKGKNWLGCPKAKEAESGTTRRQGQRAGSLLAVTCDLLLDLALHRPQSSHLYNEGADLEGGSSSHRGLCEPLASCSLQPWLWGGHM